MAQTSGIQAGDTPAHEGLGIFYAVCAYLIWGALPIYWRMLDAVAPVQLAFHRILWCAVAALVVTLARHRYGRLRSILHKRKLVLLLAASGVLVSANWTIFIVAIAHREVVETSLGYFINPILSILMGVFILREKLSPVRTVAVCLAGGALLVKALLYGHFPYIAVSLALTFGFYGFVRKLVPVDALDGLCIESLIVTPVIIAYLLWFGFTDPTAFPRAPLKTDLMLILGGPFSALPLALFAAGARKMRLTTMGFTQYISPTLILMVAVFVFHEPFGLTDIFCFGCIWLALILVTMEGHWPRHKDPQAVPADRIGAGQS